MNEAQKDQKIQNMVGMAKFQNYIHNQKNLKNTYMVCWTDEQSYMVHFTYKQLRMLPCIYRSLSWTDAILVWHLLQLVSVTASDFKFLMQMCAEWHISKLLLPHVNLWMPYKYAVIF
jgi:hypothetical protein